MSGNNSLALKNFLLVGIGAIPGVFVRWLMNNYMAVNIIGAALLGLVMGLRLKPNVKLALGFGFCGALTTFSGWMLEVLELVKRGFWLQGIGLIVLTLLLGIVSLFAGFLMGTKIKQIIDPS